MAHIIGPVQQLSQVQLEHLKFFERTKSENKQFALDIKKNLNKLITGLARNLCIFMGIHGYHCRQTLQEEARLNFMILMAFSTIWVAIHCFVSYHMIKRRIKLFDRLLEMDEALRRYVDIFARNLRDSEEIYQVMTREVGGGTTVVTDIKISPHVMDHGECVSQLSCLKELVKEPLVGFNYGVVYGVFVVVIFLFGVVYFIGLAVISEYTMQGSESLNRHNLNSELLMPT